jgi:hypothetical protein
MMNRALGGNDENAMLMYFGYSYPGYIASNYYDANNHIFHTLLVNFMSSWFGEENALAIRFPTFIFGMACLWMIYLTALELFQSKKIANTALLIAAVNPIHIHYSQTARGYSLVMFFSIVVIYYSLKLLRSGKKRKEIIPLVLCGFLSVYTLPTNILFLCGLGTWLGIIILTPSMHEEYGVSREEQRNKALYFFGAGVLIALISFLAYIPVLEEMQETARNHHLLTIDAKTGDPLNLATSISEKIFQGPLLWFLPFLILGCVFDSRMHRSHLLLLLCIYFIPLLITLVTGVGGYPRNYLFNLPLFVIFLAAGFFKAGEWANKKFRGGQLAGWITALFTVISLGIVLFEYYPSMQVPDPTSYQQNIQKHASQNDLILITDPKNFLYARTTAKKNLLQIIQDNKLTGVKAILPKSANIGKYEIFSTKGSFPIFKGLPNMQDLPSISLDEKRKMIPITGKEVISVLQNDFEADSKWQKISGDGEISKLDTHVLFGKQSLDIQASPEQSMILGFPIHGEFPISKPSLIVLIWASKKFEKESLTYHPILLAQAEFGGKAQSIQILTGKINDGINIQYKEKTGSSETYYWFARSAIGILPPGRYTFKIMINSDAGQRVLYDGFRLFIASLA